MTRTILHLFLAIGAAIFPLPRGSHAGCRHVQFIHQQAAVVYQPVTQPYYWAVGSGLQEDAQAQRIAAKVLQLLQAAPQAQQQTAPCPTCQTPAPQTLPLSVAEPMSLMAQNCAGCHRTNEKANEAFNMDDLSALTCEQKLAAIAAVVDGRMPKAKQLDPATLGNLIGQLSGAETAPK